MAVTTSILLTVLILIAAFVIDLGLVRADVRSSQSATDAAVTAAGLELDPTEPNAFESACIVAWQYFLSNVGSDPSTPDPCNDFSDSEFFQGGITCASRAASGGPVTETASVDAPLRVVEPHGQYTFRIQMPVRDSDSLMTTQPPNPEFDGDDPCERIGISVTLTRSNVLAGVAGFSSSASTVDAVSRRVRGTSSDEFATLIILEPEKCLAVDSQGGTGVVVFNMEDTSATPPRDVPGVITSDSNGDECGGEIYDTGGGGYICAGVWPVPRNRDYLDAAEEIDATTSCDTAETDIIDDTLRSFAPPAVWGTPGPSMQPDVTAAPGRVTRQPVDHAYNCRSSYPAFDPSSPTFNEQYYAQDDGDEPATGPCTTRDLAGIDLVVNAFIDAPVVHRTAGTPANGFQEVDCSNPVESFTHVIVNCKKSGATPLQLHLDNAEVVVLEQFAPGSAWGVSIGNGEYLRVTPASDDAIMVLPEGGIDMSNSAELELNQTFVYLHDGDGAGLNSSASGPLSWTAPVETGWNEQDNGPDQRAGCQDYALGGHTLPTAACFEDLALWSNSITNPQKLAGSANIAAEGIFFLPNAGRSAANGSFALNGSGPGLDLKDAQFFVWRMSLAGQSPVIMRPDPDRFISTPAFGVGLIR